MMLFYYTILTLMPIHFALFFAIRREKERNRKILMGIWRLYPTRRIERKNVN